ncbi:MAG: hypothetical protein K0Q94_6549, partial [Paenibacillus sp.]|nr:hypothetical protein [Paenibacillus sp.]
SIGYKQFGAVGDGTNDDGVQIKNAHAYANERDLPIVNASGEYWIKATNEIVIQTNVSWGSTKLHIDESFNTRTNPRFRITSRKSEVAIALDAAAKASFLAQMKPGTTLIPELAPYKNSLIFVVDSNDKIGVRYGYTHNGWNREEFFYIEEHGRLVGDIAWTFTNYTSLVAYPCDDSYLVIDGGTFYMSGTSPGANGAYLHNGILVRRSRTIIRNQWVGLEEGAVDVSLDPRSGFYYFNNVFDVTLENVRLIPWEQDREGTDRDVPAGTYGIGGARVLNATFRNVTAEGSNVHWGVFGTNLFKNFRIESCRLNRVDVHFHCWNLYVKDSEIGYRGFTLTGGGDLFIENTKRFGSRFIDFRVDYGAKWDGNIRLKNCRLVATSGTAEAVALHAVPANFNYKYPIGYGRSIRIEDFIFDYTGVPNPTGVCRIMKIATFSKITSTSDRLFFPHTIEFGNVGVVGREKGVRIMDIANPLSFQLGKPGGYDANRVIPNCHMRFVNIQGEKVPRQTSQSTANVNFLLNALGTAVYDDEYALHPKIEIVNCGEFFGHFKGAIAEAYFNGCTVNCLDAYEGGPMRGRIVFDNCQIKADAADDGKLLYSLSAVHGVSFVNCTIHAPLLDGTERPDLLARYDFININNTLRYNHLGTKLSKTLAGVLRDAEKSPRFGKHLDGQAQRNDGGTAGAGQVQFGERLRLFRYRSRPTGRLGRDALGQSGEGGGHAALLCRRTADSRSGNGHEAHGKPPVPGIRSAAGRTDIQVCRLCKRAACRCVVYVRHMEERLRLDKRDCRVDLFVQSEVGSVCRGGVIQRRRQDRDPDRLGRFGACGRYLCDCRSLCRLRQLLIEWSVAFIRNATEYLCVNAGRKSIRGVIVLMRKLGRWLLLLALVFTMFPLYPTETRAETLPLLNGGFDSGFTGWNRLHGNAANMTVTSEIKYSGGFSLKIKDLENNGSYAMISDRHPVSAGKQVTASAKLYVSGGTGSLYLYFYNAAGTMIHSVFSNKSSPQTEWTDVSITSGVPEGAVQVSVVLATSIVNVGTVYFDNVGLTASVPLANGGFESGLTGWNAAYGSQQRMTSTTEAAFSGVRSLKIDDNSSASSFGMESDKFPVTPGKQYTAEARARVESGGGAVYLRFYNAANQQLDQKATSAGAAPGQWRSVTATLVAPEGAATASILLYSALANMGTIYFDEVSVSEISLVRGTVTDAAAGSPVAWAAAYLYDAADTGFEAPLDKAVTDINGKYTFSKSVADGSYAVRAAKDGYLHGTAAVQVGGTGTGVGAVSLAKDTAAALYTVSGQVYVPGVLQPLAGVNIALYDDDDLAYTTALGAAVSATDGTFALDRTVPNGRYSARAVKAGYYTAAFPVTVRDGPYTEALLQMPAKSNVTQQNMPKPPAAHPRLYVTPELVPQLQAKIQTPAFQPIWSKLLGLAYIPQYTGRSSGTTLQMEHYAFPAAENARYVKLFGRGNSTNQWNSITETEIYARDTSGQRVKLPVLSADWSSQDRQYDGNNTIDGNLDAESRWSAEGVEEWIRYDLGAASTITDLGIAWYSGNTRTSYFDIYVSGDGHNWRLIDLGLGKQPGLLDPPPVGQSNYSASLKNAIEYNAMKYLLTGDAASGRLAIRTV